MVCIGLVCMEFAVHAIIMAAVALEVRDPLQQMLGSD